MWVSVIRLAPFIIFIVMRNNIFIYCIIVASTILITKLVIEESSSPVEEMYHKQLVTTIDSILDARFSPGYCKEVVDRDSISVPPTLFRNHSNMEIMK